MLENKRSKAIVRFSAAFGPAILAILKQTKQDRRGIAQARSADRPQFEKLPGRTLNELFEVCVTENRIASGRESRPKTPGGA